MPLKDQDFNGVIYIGTKKDDWDNAVRKSLLGQWFQTILITDQRLQPWFSKGFMNYYDQRLINLFKPQNNTPEILPYINLCLRVAEIEKTT